MLCALLMFLTLGILALQALHCVVIIFFQALFKWRQCLIFNFDEARREIGS